MIRHFPMLTLLIVTVLFAGCSNNEATVNLKYALDDEVTVKITKDMNIKELLKENNYSFDTNDIIKVNDKVVDIKYANLRDGDSVTLIEVTTEETTVEEEIEYSVIETEDNSASVGSRTVKVKGSKGKKEIIYSVVYYNGVFYDALTTENIVVKAVDQIEIVGTKPVTSNGGGGNSSNGGSSGSGGTNGPGGTSGGSSSGGNSSSSGANTNPPSSCTITINGVVHPCND